MAENRIENKLVLDISDFVNKITVASQRMKGLGDVVDKSVGSDELVKRLKQTEEYIDTIKEAVKESNEEIKRLTKQTNDAFEKYDKSGSKKDLSFAQEQGAFLKAEMDKRTALVAKEKELLDIREQLVKALKEEEKKSDKKTFVDGISEGVRGLRRLTLGIIGIQNGWQIVKKIAGENEKLSNATQAMWKALASTLEPTFNWIAGIIKQIIGYFASFVYYISGVNILDKALKNGAKSAKSIKNSLAGFDEINNLDNSGGGNNGWMGALKDIKINTEWVKDFDALTGIPSLFKDMVTWIKDPSWDNFKKVLGNTNALLEGMGILLLGLGTPFSSVLGWLALIVGLFKQLDIHVNEFTGTLSVNTDGWSDSLKAFGKKFEAWKQGIFDGLVNIVRGIGDWFKELIKKVRDLLTPLSVATTDIGAKIGNVFKGFLNGIISFVEGAVNFAIKGVNAIIKLLNKISFTIPDWVPAIGGKSFGINISPMGSVSLGRLETGTNFVPNDGLAYIHQGEAVIPKKFNDKEYFGGGNEETNQLLTNILNIVSNMDMKPTVAVSDIVKGINKQSRLKGVSVL